MEKHMEHIEEKNTSRIILIFMAAAVLLMQVYGLIQKEQTNIWSEEGTANLLNDEQIEQQVEEILASMSMEQKIYQMFMVTPEALTEGVNVSTADETMYSMLKERPVGGLVYFSGNLINAEQTKEMLYRTQLYAADVEGMPLFLGVDEEGGKAARKSAFFRTPILPKFLPQI